MHQTPTVKLFDHKYVELVSIKLPYPLIFQKSKSQWDVPHGFLHVPFGLYLEKLNLKGCLLTWNFFCQKLEASILPVD